ncbi:MAG: helix-turn-helix transcriptional regulator [Deltaproteobacteria bacterium]|nr:helix-turn-helix transcriptional regulator [Deltaproteobacteria bacterium]
MAPSDVAVRAGLSRSTVCRWLTGASKPTRVTLMAVAAVLGVDPAKLVRRA